MDSSLIKRLYILGGLVIIGIITVQSYWLLKTWDLKDQEFDQTVNIILRKVAEHIAEFNHIELPTLGLIQRTSSNYYAVNINSGVDANILEHYLLTEMQNHSLNIDFEYAVYDCFSKDLVYGNYCKLSDDETPEVASKSLPTFTDLDYYFVVKFPSRESYLLSNMFLKQKRLSELQKDFINNMTHEFKTPISSIKIAADVLAKDPNLVNNDRMKRYTTIIKDQNTRLNDQVEKVLNIARIEKDNFELNIQSINLRETLSNIVEQETLRLQNGKITLEIDKPEVIIRADKLHFTNVVTNIIDNAIKYGNGNPEISIKVQSENDIQISISDNGIGIDKENLKKIFDKFYRVSTGNVHNIKGFGLGLFYVHNICRAHRWILSADSTLGEGTTIKIRIPNE